MSTDVSRRDVLRGAMAGGALCIGVSLTGGFGCGSAQKRRIRHADKTGELDVNMYITVLPTGMIRLAVNKAEIGQGVTTGYTTMVAEELEVELEMVEFHFADSLPEYKTSGVEGVPLFAAHATGGSTSTREAYIPLRQAAAAAREMLVAAAADEWKASKRACRAEGGSVVHSDGRKLGYGELTKRAARKSAPKNPRIKKPGEFRLIGKRARRVDVLDKVTGKTTFGIDTEVPNMVKAVVIHGPQFGAEPRTVNANAAKAMRGVLDVFPFRWGVAVVAEKYWQAKAASAVVEVDWKPGLVAGLDTEKLRAASLAYKKSGGVIEESGDAKGHIKRDQSSVDAVYEAPFLAHAPLEPQNCIVSVTGSKAEVWAPCQVPTVIQEALKDAIGVDAEDVLVHTTYSGGGFGRRLVGDVAQQAAIISKRLKRPVQLIWSRESDMQQGFYRPAATTFMRGSVAGSTTKALHYHSLSQPITLDQPHATRGGQPGWLPHFSRSLGSKTFRALFSANTNIDWFSTEGASHTPYRIPNRRFEYTPISTRMPVGFWRSVGHSYNAFTMEGFIDELADAAKTDPYKFRRDMLEAGGRERRVLDAVATLAEWDKPAPAGSAKGIARHTSFGTEVAEVAEVTVENGRIRVTKVWAVVDCGVVINPDIVAAQIEGGIIFGLSAALDQEITMVDGVVQQGNYDDFPALRMHECPAIEVQILASDAKPTGVGEPGLPPIAPAVANALFKLTGARVRRLPMQPTFSELRQGGPR